MKRGVPGCPASGGNSRADAGTRQSLRHWGARLSPVRYTAVKWSPNCSKGRGQAGGFSTSCTGSGRRLARREVVGRFRMTVAWEDCPWGKWDVLQPDRSLCCSWRQNFVRLLDPFDACSAHQLDGRLVRFLP